MCASVVSGSAMGLCVYLCVGIGSVCLINYCVCLQCLVCSGWLCEGFGPPRCIRFESVGYS